MSPRPGTRAARADLLALYDAALPDVYGYLVARCRERALAEDLTAETFLAAVEAVRRDKAAPLSTRWLIGVARHKLADHWRRAARETARLRRVTDPVIAEDPWPERLDALAARATLDSLGPAHRLVLTLRYVDDIDAAVARVQAAGGTAGPVERKPYGLVCACTDGQGGRFWLASSDIFASAGWRPVGGPDRKRADR